MGPSSMKLLLLMRVLLALLRGTFITTTITKTIDQVVSSRRAVYWTEYTSHRVRVCDRGFQSSVVTGRDSIT